MKLAALRIRNFKLIGDSPVEILIDNIVVLVGPNNAGKSSVLDAYESYARGAAALPIQCFHNECAETPVEIEGVFIEYQDQDRATLGSKCVGIDARFGECVRVKYQWDAPDEKGQKYTWDDSKEQWQKGGAGGLDSLLSSAIPQPLRINPIDSPADREKQIIDILAGAIKSALKNDSAQSKSITIALEELANKISATVQTEIDETCSLVQTRLNKIFADHEVCLTPAAGNFDADKIIATGTHVRIARGGQSIPLTSQGTGLQRAFLWSALGAFAELGKAKKGRVTIDAEKPKILLIDEPESFLHPPAIRDARESLYQVADISGWQVLASTHSPIFIDVAKPHTTIIRVDSSSSTGPRVFQSEKADFSDDDRLVLQMIRACHPTVNEFFFSENVVLVEGNTEVAVLEELRNRSQHPDASSLQIVNCLGKNNLILFAKILNQFGSPYTILHDSDAPRAKRQGKYIKNSAWTANQNICDVVASRSEKLAPVFKVAHTPDFETVYFGDPVQGDKPFNAIKKLSLGKFEKDLDKLFEHLLNKTHPGRYDCIEELEQRTNDYYSKSLSDTPEVDHELWQLSENVVVEVPLSTNSWDESKSGR